MTTIFLILLAIPPWDMPTESEYIEGKSTFYAHGVMEDVLQYRKIDLTGYAGGIVLNRKGDLLREAWVVKDGVVYGRYLVIDCAKEGDHYKVREDAGLVLEVSWEQSREWHMNGPSEFIVRVYFSNPKAWYAQRSRYVME